MGPRVFDQTPDAAPPLASPSSSHQLQGEQKLQLPPMKQETSRPSPRPGRPPPLPSRPSPPSPAVVVEPDGADAAAQRAASNPADDDGSAEAAGLVSSGADDERLLHLAKLMLSPEGLAMTKITLEGYSVPVALRLIDRRQQQRLEERRNSISSSTTAIGGGGGGGASGGASISPLLAITWLDSSDTFGFDLRGVTSIRRGHEADGSGVAAAGRKRGRGGGGGGGGSCHNASSLVLSWGAGEIGPSKVILAAASPELRDLVMLTLEMLVHGLQGGGDDDDDVAEEERAGSTAVVPHVVKQGTEEGGEPAGSRNIDPAAPTATTAVDTESDDERAAAVLARFDNDSALPPHQTDPASSATPHRGGGLRERLFSSDAASAAAELNSSRRASLGLHRRGASFSSGGAAPARSVPGLERARTVGASVIGRESEARQVLEQEQEARRRREEAMARLLAVYDRARDESQAAECRLGVSLPTTSFKCCKI